MSKRDGKGAASARVEALNTYEDGVGATITNNASKGQHDSVQTLMLKNEKELPHTHNSSQPFNAN